MSEKVTEKQPEFDLKFFQNRACTYYPCHQGVPDEEFSCMFCYCPLYALGEDCGGNFRYTENGIKDCSACTVPHRKKNYDHMIQKSVELVGKVQQEHLDKQKEKKE